MSDNAQPVVAASIDDSVVGCLALFTLPLVMLVCWYLFLYIRHVDPRPVYVIVVTPTPAATATAPR